MRKTVFEGTAAQAVELFARVPFVHLAGVGPDGRAILRTLHAVVVDDGLVFHAGVVGEKLRLEGRPVVVTAEEVVANVPSYAIDPERACPATTYYRAAEVRGVLEPVECRLKKARLMQALMQRFQPEGGHAEIEPDAALYAGALRGVRLLRVDLEPAKAKIKLGQNRRPEQLARVVALLWKRGAPGDVEAIEALRPFVPTPGFLAAPEGVRLCCAPTADDADAVASLLEDTEWNRGVDHARRARAQRGAAAWIVARLGDDVVGSVRVVSDGARFAYVGDVIVRVDVRGRGIATAMLRAALDHPAVRDADEISLRTVDAMPLYEAFGFTPTPRRPEVTHLRRTRAGARVEQPIAQVGQRDAARRL